MRHGMTAVHPHQQYENAVNRSVQVRGVNQSRDVLASEKSQTGVDVLCNGFSTEGHGCV